MIAVNRNRLLIVNSSDIFFFYRRTLRHRLAEMPALPLQALIDFDAAILGASLSGIVRRCRALRAV